MDKLIRVKCDDVQVAKAVALLDDGLLGAT